MLKRRRSPEVALALTDIQAEFFVKDQSKWKQRRQRGVRGSMEIRTSGYIPKDMAMIFTHPDTRWPLFP